MANIKDAKMVYLESDIDKIKIKTNLYIQEYNEEGAFHLAREIIQNSIDELIDENSIGSDIHISYDMDTDILTCEDTGRGFSEVDYPLDIFCTTIQSGSKFNREDGASSGEFGVGLTVVNALSDVFEITSYRLNENTVHTLRYENGKKVSDKTTPNKRGVHGTRISFKASKKYLGKDTVMPIDKVVKWVDTMMYFPMNNSKIKIKFEIWDGKKLVDSFKFKKKEFGELLSTIITDKKYSPQVTLTCESEMEEEITDKDGNSKIVRKPVHVDVAFAYQPEGYLIDSYCNYTHTTDGGIHVTTFEKVFCNYMQNTIKASMSDSQREKLPILWDDVRNGLYCIINLSTSAAVRFEGNMKTKIGGVTLIPVLTDMLQFAIENYFSSNQAVFNNFAQLIKLNAKARIEATAVKNAVKVERVNNLSVHSMENFTPCINTGNKYKEIYLTEGNSAGGNARDASSPECMAIFLLRGVIPNAFKTPLTKLMENKEISSLITVLRCGIGKNFDINKLYYDRICIFTDEDVDGFYISSLILALFYCYMPEVIKAGRLFKVFTPLYQLDDKDHEFVANKKEMIKIYHKKLIKNYKIRPVSYTKWFDKDQFKEFLKDTYNYRTDLINAAKRMGSTNKFFVEIVSAYLVILGVINTNTREINYDILHDQKFIRRFTSTIQKKYKEVYIDEDYNIRGIIDGKLKIIQINDRFIKKIDDLLPVYAKYGYSFVIKEKDGAERDMTIGEYLDSCTKYYASIIHRFKGLGEISAEALRKYAMDMNNRVSVVYTMSSAKEELEKFNKLFGASKKDLELRKLMMSTYKISRDDLDN